MLLFTKQKNEFLVYLNKCFINSLTSVHIEVELIENHESEIINKTIQFKIIIIYLFIHLSNIYLIPA